MVILMLAQPWLMKAKFMKIFIGSELWEFMILNTKRQL